jgi:hypothetical protein
LAARTASSSGRLARNDRARLSVLVALVALAILPVALYATKKADWLRLTHAVGAVAVAETLLGLLAIALARAGRRDIELTLGRIGGGGAARFGRILGLLAVFVGVSAACALGFYGLLILFGKG